MSGDCSANSMIKTGLDGSVCNFYIDYAIINTSNITNIHKYLMKKDDIK